MLFLHGIDPTALKLCNVIKFFLPVFKVKGRETMFGDKSKLSALSIHEKYIPTITVQGIDGYMIISTALSTFDIS